MDGVIVAARRDRIPALAGLDLPVDRYVHCLSDAMLAAPTRQPWLIDRELDDCDGWLLADALHDAFPYMALFIFGSARPQAMGHRPAVWLDEDALDGWADQISLSLELGDEVSHPLA